MSHDQPDLISRVQSAPQRMRHIDGRGDPEGEDAYRIIVTAKERDIIIAALRLRAEVNSSIGDERGSR